MADTTNVRWFNGGATSTMAPKLGVYKVFNTSMPKTRDQERVSALNTELRSLTN